MAKPGLTHMCTWNGSQEGQRLGLTLVVSQQDSGKGSNPDFLQSRAAEKPDFTCLSFGHVGVWLRGFRRFRLVVLFGFFKSTRHWLINGKDQCL